MSDARVLATKITVDAFFDIVLDDPTAARGVRIASDDAAREPSEPSSHG